MQFKEFANGKNEAQICHCLCTYCSFPYVRERRKCSTKRDSNFVANMAFHRISLPPLFLSLSPPLVIFLLRKSRKSKQKSEGKGPSLAPIEDCDSTRPEVPSPSRESLVYSTQFFSRRHKRARVERRFGKLVPFSPTRGLMVHQRVPFRGLDSQNGP